MESACVYDEKKVLHELTQAKQMAEQLIANPSSAQANDLLIQKILSKYYNALHLLNSGLSAGQPPPFALPAPGLLESSMPFGSPGSEAFKYDQPFSGQEGENIISKKRKRCTSDNGLESDTDDGFNWRKYGQKDILGTKFPRSYYRCSYRYTQKCYATKHIQRSDEDPAEVEIVYKGIHTCTHAVHSASPPPPPPSPEKHEITPTHHHHQLSPPSPDEMPSNLRTNLNVNTLDLDGINDTVPSLFSFPSTSSGVMEDNHQFQFPCYYDSELFPFTSESFFFPDCGSSQSLDFLADPADFEFNSLL